jgi:transglutaminase-like putative cysteine protease
VTGATQARVALAGFAATMLAALTLAPLIQGLAWLVATFVVVALTAGVGASMRQVTGQALIVTAAELAMLVITLTALFARDSALWGVLPGPAAVDTLRGLLSQGLDITRHDSPPVDTTRGLLLLTAGGVGVIGLLVDLIAVTLRRPAAAGLPLLAVYCVPAAVLPDGLPWGYFLLCGAGYLVLVGADAGDRVRAWGRLLSGVPGDPEAGLGGPLSGARRVAVAGLVIAAAAPALVPGLGGRFLGHGSGSGTGQGRGTTISVVNPILNLRADLGSRSNQPVITYKTDVQNPQPLRIVTDDQFNGALWQPSTGSLARSQDVRTGLPSAPGLSPAVPASRHLANITIGALAQTYLPLPYPTTKVDIEGLWLWDARTLNVVGEGMTTQNLRYAATYLVVAPTPEQLAAAGKAPADVVARYGALPKNLPAVIGRSARTVAGRGTSWEQAVKLQAWFRNGGGFTYSEKAPGNARTDSGQDAVAAFLQARTGYCVQFASAMAVMARSLGIPARVAVGFLPGSTTDGRTYTITLRDAHAWPELYFEGVGWIRFEPTPATRTGQPPAWTLPPQTIEPAPSASASAGAGPSAQPSAKPRPDLPDPRVGAAAGSAGPLQWLKAIPWRVVGIVALVLLGLAAPRLATDLVRRRRWHRATTDVQRAEAAWEELRESLQDLGVGWAASWTPRALQLRLVSERELDPDRRSAMARLVGDLEHARYAPPGAPVRTAGELREDVRAVVSGVAVSVATGIRRRAAFFPASGVAVIAGLVRNVDAAASQAGARASSLGSQVRRTVGAGSRSKD